MKKLILILAIVAFSQATICQVSHKEIPQRIANSFSTKFPSAHLKNWKIREDNYVAEFFSGTKKSFAFYSPDADWLRTETKIKWNRDLPDLIKRTFFKSKYASWTINEIKEIQTPNEHVYIMHVNDGNLLDSDHYDVFRQDNILYFTTNGKLEKSIALN